VARTVQARLDGRAEADLALIRGEGRNWLPRILSMWLRLDGFAPRWMR
jgi:hypothetical protein